jgi:LacI family transcriptional regulator
VNQTQNVALVFMTKAEENVRILSAIAKYNRFHERWSAFVDDDAVAWNDPDWILGSGTWHGAMCKHYAPPFFQRCLEKGIPCVDLSDHPDRTPGIPKVRPDNRAIGEEAAEYFLEKGFRNFGFCGFATENWSSTRGSGFCDALFIMGMQSHKLETAYPDFYHGPICNPCGPQWDEHERHLIEEWLDSIPKPVGIFCCNDMRGLQVLEACRSLGIHVPGEVAVLGANNDLFRCELSQPQLSSIPVNTDFYGTTAARLLAEMMAGVDHSQTEIMVDPLGVISRHSTDFTHIQDRTIIQALDLIWDRSCKGITVEEIAKAVNVSRSLLERKFRRYLGKSPQAEIRKVQLTQVKKLLSETDYTLDQVAELAGYQHPEYMHAVFKKQTSMTPSQYRRKFTPSLVLREVMPST